MGCNKDIDTRSSFFLLNLLFCLHMLYVVLLICYIKIFIYWNTNNNNTLDSLMCIVLLRWRMCLLRLR